MPRPPSDSPRTNDSNNPNNLHCTCCACRNHGSPSNQGDDAGAFHSDNPTVNDTASEHGRSSRRILEYHGTTRPSHVKLIRDRSPKYPVPTDSFDYEQKYAPDDEYKEMSETARVFETYMDECTKFDFDMVENWRDGLDMLLVFAALFSAVVTTLVVQSSQSLRVDYAEVTTTLMLRLIDIETAISLGDPAPHAQNSNPSASFRAKSGDLWVNGLWLTSLVLSLTTTLIAVLTKQWINEYMILPSGTPRDRARIRHFRFIGLQQWRVPLIIGLLPVLMHVSLGVFFAGFLIFVYSLSSTMATALSCVTAIGALAYLISNILPLFYANCPYKTPLALYSFMLVSSIRRHLESWRSRHTPVKSNISRSLKDVERTSISCQTDELDALAVSWLHNASSNASVQSIAVQSLGSLPLQSIGIITGSHGIKAPASDPAAWRFLDFADVDDKDRPAVILAIRAHHRIDHPVDRLERLQRAAMRFGKYDMLSHAPNKYDIIYSKSAERCIDFIRNSLLGKAADGTTFDVVFWGKAFEAALQSGLDFLEIGVPFKDGSPTLWGKLLECIVQHHNCTASNCSGQHHELFSFSLAGPAKAQIPLHIHRYSLEENGTSATLCDALATNMRPSFVKWLLMVGFPFVIRAPDSYTEDLPDDIFLVLTMLQTPCIQATSSLCQHAPEDSLFYKVLYVVHEYAFTTEDCTRHDNVDRAAIFALQSVIESEAFGSSTVISLADEALMVEILFSSLNRDPMTRHPSWLTPTLFQKIWRVASAAPLSATVHKGWRVLAHVFTYVSHFTSQLGATETIFAYLLEKDWLHDIGVEYTRLARSTDPNIAALSPQWCPGYTFIAVTYIDFLSLHANNSSEILTKARRYMEEPAHLATLAKILLVAGCDTQQRLWRLAGMARSSDSWEDSIKELSRLAACPGIGEEYAYVKILASATIHGNREVHFRPLDELAALVETFKRDVRRNHYSPPVCARTECCMKALVPAPAVMGSQPSVLERWRRLFRY